MVIVKELTNIKEMINKIYIIKNIKINHKKPLKHQKTEHESMQELIL